MKFRKLSLCVLLVSILSVIILAGCTTPTAPSGSTSDEESLPYSKGIDENGFWEGIKALDYVELPEYKGIQVPSESSAVTDEEVQTQVDTLLSSHSTSVQITDRAVADGDTVNIDYVGSIDGVEFEGGSTRGEGSDVTIGTTNFIDDFLEQLIGHMPGETINVEVTFPDDYGKEELNGKDAVFITSINYIVETTEAELTDEFVQQTFLADHGWNTVDEMKAGVREDLKREAARSFIEEFLISNATVKSVPETIITYQEDALVRYYTEYAAYYGVEIEEFLSTNLGVSSMDELIESNASSLNDSASYSLIIQAIAEDQNIVPTEDDVLNYFVHNMGIDDYSEYAATYGMPYLKQVALSNLVMNFLLDNAELL